MFAVDLLRGNGMRLKGWGTLLLVAVAVVSAVKLGRRFLGGEGPSTSVAVTLETKPLGAEIWLDGFPSGKVTPATLSVNSALPHQLSFRLRGWMRREEILPAGQPAAALAFELSEAGTVKVSSVPPGAEVSDRSGPLGLTPTSVEVPASVPSRLTVSLDGFLPASTLATVASHEVLEWSAHLRPAGVLEISSEPAEVVALVDGEPVGKTPVDAPVEAGVPHVVQIALAGMSASRTVTVAAQATQKVALRLEDQRDKRIRASLQGLAKQMAADRAQIAALERHRSNQVLGALAATRKAELLTEEIDRLEQRRDDLEGELALHRTDLDERASHQVAQ
jgi:PEGA domain